MAGEIVAASWELPTYVVGSGDPFNCMVDAGTKLDPDTAIVTFAPPRGAEAGEMLDTVGTGLGITVIVKGLEVPIFGLVTVMVSVPTEVR